MELKYIIPFLTLLVGTLIGHWLAIGRDRRKFFNEVANPLFERLEKQKLIAIAGNFPPDANQTNCDVFIQLERCESKFKKEKLKVAVNMYLEAKKHCGTYDDGIYKFDKPDVLIDLIVKLQSFLPHK